MKVKTLRKHNNQFSDKFVKNIGKIYEHPQPEPLILAGIVEEHKAKANKKGADTPPSSQ